MGKPRVALWSGNVLTLDVLGGLRAVWSLGICFPLSVVIPLVAGSDSVLLSVPEVPDNLVVPAVQIILHPGT